MTTARKILSNTFVQVAGKIIIAGIGLVISKLLANYLTIGERGMYESVYALLALVGIVADMGMYTVAIREMAGNPSKMEVIIGNILSIRNVLAAISIVVTFLLIFFVPSLQMGWIFYGALFWASLGMILALLNGTVTSVLQVAYDMKHATIAQVIGKILTMLCMVFGMFFLFPKQMPGFESTTPFWAFQMLFIVGLVGNTCMYLYTRHFVKKHVNLRYRFDRVFWKDLIKKALPYGLALILGTVYFKIDLLIILFMYPAEMAHEQIGYYSAAIKVVEIFNVLPQFFLNAALPMMTAFIVAKNPKIKELIQYSFDFLYIMALPIVVGGVVMAYAIINATSASIYLTSNVGQGFYSSDLLLQVIIFTIGFSFLNSLFNFLLVALSRQKILIYINCLCLLFNIVFNVIGIHFFGVMACAVTTVLTEVLVLVCSSYAVRQHVDFGLNLWRFTRTTLAGLVMGATLWFLKDPLIGAVGNTVGLLIILFMAGIVYGGGLYLFRVVDKPMLAILRKKEA
ncbi:hypothetical protein COW46_03980 [Candidatus Gracilibacteria bacterium CG17_big_fil_post_rev_8_21_14_2_50_48_13]|nr:MAG: hypothetical protein COW46_03980 [Candidatus Gracilibacteria bacterium CG17_big_fil_post_rev_8_21_14_2_50_48_13]